MKLLCALLLVAVSVSATTFTGTLASPTGTGNANGILRLALNVVPSVIKNSCAGAGLNSAPTTFATVVTNGSLVSAIAPTGNDCLTPGSGSISNYNVLFVDASGALYTSIWTLTGSSVDLGTLTNWILQPIGPNTPPNTGGGGGGGSSGTPFTATCAGTTTSCAVTTSLASFDYTQLQCHTATAFVTLLSYSTVGTNPVTSVTATYASTVGPVVCVVNAGGSTGPQGPTGPTGPGAAWGTLSGTLSSQTDLQTALNLKAPLATIRAISFSFDGGGAALTSGKTLYLRVPFACTISSWSVLSTTAETVTLKLWKVASGTAVPTVANSINTSGISLASGTAVVSTTLTDFTTTAVTANDIVAANITAVTASQFVNLIVVCTQ